MHKNVAAYFTALSWGEIDFITLDPRKTELLLLCRAERSEIAV